MGTASPRSLLSFGTADTSGTNGINLYDNGGNYRTGIGATSSYLRLYTPSDGSLQLGRLSTSDGSTFLEAARIDNSGRLLVGTSTARSIATQSWGIQQEGTNYSNTGISLTANRNDADSAYLVFAKTRGTSVGSVTSVNSQDNLGGIFFAGADGSTVNSYGAAITAFTDGTPGTNDMPGRLVFSTTADGAASPTERLRITSAGRVGIGTTSVSRLLHISAASGDTPARIQTATSGAFLEFQDSATTAGRQPLIGAIGDNLVVYTSAGSYSERLRITSAGLVGIGTSVPAYTLVAKGGVATTGIVASIINPVSGGNSKIHFTDDATYNWTAGTVGNAFAITPSEASTSSGTPALYINSSSRVGIGTTSPGSFNADLSKLVVGGGSGSEGILVYSGTSSTGNIAFHDNADTSFSGMIRYDHSSNAMSFWTNGVNERARIDSSGRLLIGTSTAFGSGVNQVATTGQDAIDIGSFGTTPSYGGRLTFYRSKNATVGSATAVANDDSLGRIDFRGYGVNNYLLGARIDAFVDGEPSTGGDTTDMPGRLVFSTTADGASSPTERMRINNQGHIGFGTNVDINNLPGGGTNNATGVAVASNIFKACSSNYTMQVGVSSTGAGYALMQIFQNGTQCGGITVSNSNATAFVTSSDYRLKENIAPIQNAGSRLLLLRPSSFNFQNNPGVVIDGFIAHEVQAVVPEAIHGTKDEVDDDGNPVYQGIDQSKLVPLLTAALQEAIVKIETLEARLTAAGIE